MGDKYHGGYHSTPKAKKNRAACNKARRQAIKDGRAKKGDGKHCDHVVPLSAGGSRNGKVRCIDATANRQYKRGKGNTPARKQPSRMVAKAKPQKSRRSPARASRST